MKERTDFLKISDNQRGIALISALLLLLVVSLMAVGVSMDTSMDIRIAGYQKFKTRSFGFAESGMLAATDILEDNIDAAGWDASGGDLGYPNLSDLYSGSIMVKQSHGNFYMDENSGCPPEQVLEMRGDIEADVVVQRLVAKQARGGAIQMAAGYAGLGKGAAGGGTHRLYNLEAAGRDAAETRTDLAVHFRHVTK
ncbi:MAG: PilX N-terminal domain-containing pilus assembly protein [Desulfobulbales bacterium]|nr:PilX N-terminal domain-containing pilus assembly protein [Desulfobulbales bacterium]